MSTAIILAMALTLGGAGVAQQPFRTPARTDVAALNRRIQEIMPTAKEKRFDEIGWVKGLREAERLAKEHQRPVFLFSNVGDMDIGRC